MRPHVSPIRRCKDGFRVEDYMGKTHDFTTIDGALSFARRLVKPKRPQYVRETRGYHWQVMAPTITCHPERRKFSSGRAVK